MLESPPGGTAEVSACNMLEFRADTFALADIVEKYSQLRAHVLGWPSSDRPGLLITVRLPSDGGFWPDPPDSRYAVMENLITGFRADWLDIEIEEISCVPPDFLHLVRESRCSLLLSHHNFSGSYSLSGFQEILNRMLPFNPDIVKFAVTAGSPGELEILLEFASKFKTMQLPACVISMGKYGPASRIASPLAGAPLTYGFLGECPSAPGQIAATELRKQLKQWLKEKYYNKTLFELAAGFCKE